MGTDLIFLFKFSTFSANQNGFAIGGKDLCEKINGKGLSFVKFAGALAFVFNETQRLLAVAACCSLLLVARAETRRGYVTDT